MGDSWESIKRAGQRLFGRGEENTVKSLIDRYNAGQLDPNQYYYAPLSIYDIIVLADTEHDTQEMLRDMQEVTNPPDIEPE